MFSPPLPFPDLDHQRARLRLDVRSGGFLFLLLDIPELVPLVTAYIAYQL